MCGGRRSSRHLCSKPSKHQAKAGVVRSAVATQEGGALAQKGFPPQVRELALELDLENNTSSCACAARMIYGVHTGMECLPGGGKGTRKAPR